MAPDAPSDEAAERVPAPHPFGSLASTAGIRWAALTRHGRFVALCGVLLATMALYWPSWLSLLRMWNAFGSRFYTHGDLTAVLAAAALFHRRGRIARAQLSPRPWGAVALLTLSAAWLLADLPQIEVAYQACMPLILLTAAYTVFGPETARLCRFPALYLYSAIPIWEWIKPPLQALAVAVAGFCLPFVGVPALIRGDFVEIPAGTFEIQTGCAGEAYLIVAVAIALYYGDTVQGSLRLRLALIAVASALAILGNWVRVMVIIFMGQVTAMQSYLVRVSHDAFGWAVFAVAMLVFMGLAVLMTRRASALSLRPEGHDKTDVKPEGSLMLRTVPAGLLALAALALGPSLAALSRARVVDRTERAVLEAGAGGWKGPIPYDGAWRPIFMGADAKGLGVYASPGGQVALYIAEYFSQSDRAKLHGAGNTPLGEDQYHVQSEQQVTHAGHPLQELQVTDSQGERWLMWVTYEVGGHTAASLMRAQLWYALESLTRTPRSRVIALETRCSADCSAARTRAARFLSANPWVFTPEWGQPPKALEEHSP